MDEIMLSIVIPTKDEEACLPRLLASIRAQSVQPREIIVADAGSTDRTGEIALEFGARVVEGGMPGPGRNKGALDASGDFVLFLDADVVLDDPKFLESALEEMVRRELDLATCDVFPISDSIQDKLMHSAYNKYVRAVRPLIPHAPGFCMLVRRSTHEAIKGFDETVTFCEDHDYARRAAKIGRFGFLDVKIPVSVRRLDRDGRASIAMKFVLAELHLATLGPIRHEAFNYTFGHRKS